MRKRAVAIIIFGLFCAAAGLAADEHLSSASGYPAARAFNNKGVEFVSRRQYEEAAKEFQKAIAIDPEFHIARYNLALAYYNMGNGKEAMSEFEYLVNSSYYFVDARYNLGTIYLKEGMTDKALEQLKTVVDLQPNHAEAHFNLGFIYYKKGMLDDAIGEYQKGLGIKPDSVKGRLSLAFIYEKIGKYQEAMDEYSAGLELQPDHQEATQALGSLKAIVQIKDKLKANPKDADSYVYLGHIYYARGMYAEAVDSYNKALKYAPHNKTAASSLQKAVVQLSNNP
jgi:superkiller protein 3